MSKPERSRHGMPHDWNMQCMLVTFEVSSPDKFKDPREEQPLNMKLISTTFEVSSFDRSRDLIDEQL